MTPLIVFLPGKVIEFLAQPEGGVEHGQVVHEREELWSGASRDEVPSHGRQAVQHTGTDRLDW